MANRLIARLFSASETLIAIIQLRARQVRLPRASLGRPTSKGLVRREKRHAGCHGRATQGAAIPLVLAAEVVELPRGARLSARTPDINRTGCHIDTLNPVPHGFRVRVRITHEDESLKLQEELCMAVMCRRRGISAVDSRRMSRLRSFGRKRRAAQDDRL
jgi:hypothetical protein